MPEYSVELRCELPQTYLAIVSYLLRNMTDVGMVSIHETQSQDIGPDMEESESAEIEVGDGDDQNTSATQTSLGLEFHISKYVRTASTPRNQIPVRIDLKGQSDLLEYPGIDRWDVAITFGKVEVAWITAFRIDCEVCWDLYHDVYDCGDTLEIERIAEVIESVYPSHGPFFEYDEEAEYRPDYHGWQILTLEMVWVDEYWRGRRIGPSLVAYLASVLDTGTVFLRPAAQRWIVGTDGKHFLTWDEPQPDAHADARVRWAFRRAGYKSIGGGVWEGQHASEDQQRAEELFSRLEVELQGAPAKEWYRQRRRRRPATEPGVSDSVAASLHRRR